MASIDDLFRKPNALPKRKLEDPTKSFSNALSNKSAKLVEGSSPRSSTNGSHDTTTSSNGSNGKAASVQDEALDDQDGLEAGPALPQEDVEDEPGDDEEGRFFGGGVTKQEREVIDYIDKNESGEAEEKIDSAWLRRTAINFERKINKNAELRAKYENDPMKFVGSEADLDAEIKGLSLLSEHGELYAEFVRIGSVGSLVGILAHENTDVAISACELLAELTDEDSATTNDQWNTLVQALVKADVVDLLTSNLGRLDESSETDRAGVYHILNVLENIMSDTENLEIVGKNGAMMEWLLSRIKKPDPEARAKVGQNRQYAAEILAILLQSNKKNRDRLAKKDGVDTLLELVSAYRKRDPEKDSDEEEFAENLFDCLACVVEERFAGEKFVEGEGVELCLIMLREGRLSKARALRVLDHALSGGNATAVSIRLVDAAGLKTIFGMLMKEHKMERSLLEHIIGILASLLRYLPGGSAERIRTLAKFVENDYEKITKLVDLRREYKARLSKVDAGIRRDRESLSKVEAEEQADEWLSRRLDAGLFTLQAIELILSWMVAEDNGARQTITVLLGEDGLKVLERSLKDQLEGMDPGGGDEAKATEEMLEALILCVES
jgi:beta-catenin-like protein 1